MTTQQITRRYGALMRMCRVLSTMATSRAVREHYAALRYCLWARRTRELRLAVMRH